jgi:hypothetical protein
VSGTKEDVVHASIIDMTLRLPVDDALFDELRTDFLPRAAQHPGFRGFQYVLAEQGRAIGILWYEQPEDLDGITQLVGTWFQDHMAPRLVGPETVVRGRVVVNTTPPHTTKTNATALVLDDLMLLSPARRDAIHGHEAGSVGHNGYPLDRDLRPVGFRPALEPDLADA